MRITVKGRVWSLHGAKQRVAVELRGGWLNKEKYKINDI